MRRILFVVLILIPLSLAANAQAAPAGGVKPTPKCGGSSLTNNLYRACFDGAAWQIDEPSNARFTNRDRVEVEVVHFNFLRYTLTFDVQEQKSESYQYLTKLWTSVLTAGLGSVVGGLSPLPKTASEEQMKKAIEEDVFVKNLRSVLRYSEALDTLVTQAIASHRKSGLNVEETKALKTSLENNCPSDDKWETGPEPLLNCGVSQLRKKLTDKYGDLERGVHTSDIQFNAATSKFGDSYERARKVYSDVQTRSELFQTLASKSLGVESRKVGKREAGTRVTLTLSALDAAGGRTPMGDVSYFVETTIPLVVHGGLTFSTLKDVTFDKVKRSNGFGEDDLFQKTGEAANTKSFTLFMGWRFASFLGETPNSAKLSALISLGTDVNAPGKAVYVAPTLVVFNRVAISGGLVLGKEVNGEQQTLEPDLFKIIKSKPTSKPFFSISTRVF